MMRIRYFGDFSILLSIFSTCHICFGSFITFFGDHNEISNLKFLEEIDVREPFVSRSAEPKLLGLTAGAQQTENGSTKILRVD